MNITFTKEELSQFASRLSEWYNQRSEFCVKHTMENMPSRFDNRGHAADYWESASKRFAADNPKPSWKDLLP